MCVSVDKDYNCHTHEVFFSILRPTTTSSFFSSNKSNNLYQSSINHRRMYGLPSVIMTLYEYIQPQSVLRTCVYLVVRSFAVIDHPHPDARTHISMAYSENNFLIKTSLPQCPGSVQTRTESLTSSTHFHTNTIACRG